MDTATELPVLEVSVEYFPESKVGFNTTIAHYRAIVNGDDYQPLAAGEAMHEEQAIQEALNNWRKANPTEEDYADCFCRTKHKIIARHNYPTEILEHSIQKENAAKEYERKQQIRRDKAAAIQAEIATRTAGLVPEGMCNPCRLQNYDANSRTIHVEGVSSWSNGRSHKYVNFRRFPAKADGTFNWEKIIKAVKEHVVAKSGIEQGYKTRRSLEERNTAIRDKVNAEFGFTAYSGPLCLNSSNQLQVLVTAADEDEARKIMQVLRDAGIK